MEVREDYEGFEAFDWSCKPPPRPFCVAAHSGLPGDGQSQVDGAANRFREVGPILISLVVVEPPATRNRGRLVQGEGRGWKFDRGTAALLTGFLRS